MHRWERPGDRYLLVVIFIRFRKSLMYKNSMMIYEQILI